MEEKSAAVLLVLGTLLAGSPASAARWPAPIAPVVPLADGYVAIPTATVKPKSSHVYRAVFDVTRGADRPDQLVPGLNMAGSELNVLAGSGLSSRNAKFVVVFHGGALDAVLDDAHYRAKHKVANPNLPTLRVMKKEGVEFFVCGQNLAFEDVDPKAVTPEVSIALDALVVLIAYQNLGYALMSF
jgi:intracellular sulfur oxidation DsrE/DsrF family protein